MSDDHSRLRELFVAACDLTPAEQIQLLDQKCSDDPEIRLQVENLLKNDQSQNGIFDTTNVGAVFDKLADTISEEATPIRIGRYNIKRKLGAGGMGDVFLATQENPKRDVAIKVIRSGGVGQEALRRFELETHVLGMLKHPGVAQILEAGTAEVDLGSSSFQQPYFAMEFINGKTVLQHANDAKLSVDQRLRLIVEICDAVQYAHQKGIIHRDLKPGNILVSETGKIKILDFGIARLLCNDGYDGLAQTLTGSLIGTPAYMSPEQMAGEPGLVDTRSDVYAIGVVAFELLCGQKPHQIENNSLDEVIRQKRQDSCRLSNVDKQFKGDIETVFQKALEGEKDRRYPSVSELASDIQRLLNNMPIEARPASLRYQLQKFAKRNRALVASAMLVTIVILITSILITKFSIDQSMALKESQRQIRIATEINDFLNNDLLGRANPNISGKKDVKVRELLDNAANRIDGKFEDLPQVEAALQFTLGRTYYGLGEYSLAEQHIRSAAQLLNGIADKDSDSLIDVRDNLAKCLVFQWKLKEAESWCLDNLQDSIAWLGENHRLTARCHGTLAVLLKRKGEFEQAEKQYRKSIQILQRSTDPRDMRAKNVQLNNLSLVLNDQRKRDEAELIMRHVVENWRELDSSPADTAFGLHSLASQLLEQYKRKDLSEESKKAKLEEAAALFDESLAIRLELFGENHPDTMSTIYGIGLVQKRKLDFAAALESFEQVLAVRRAIFESDRNKPVLDTLNAIGTTLNALERHRLAFEKFKLAWLTSLDAFGPTHFRTEGLYFSNMLYTLRVYLQDDIEIQKIRDSYFDELSQKSQIKLLENLSLTLAENEKLDEAIEVQIELCGLLQQTNAANGHLAWAFDLLAKFYLDQGDTQKHKIALKKAVAFKNDGDSGS